MVVWQKKTFNFSEYFILGLIILASFFLYTYKLEKLPIGLHEDEAKPALGALKIIKGQVKTIFSVGWLDIPFFNFLLPAAALKIFGQTLFGLRIGSAFLGAFILLPFYFFAKIIFKNDFFSLLATLLLATSHYYIAFSRLAMINLQTVFWEISVFLFFLKARASESRILYFLAGIFLGLGLYSYINFWVVPFILFTLFYFELVVSPDRGKLLVNFSLLAFSALVVFSPMLSFYFAHPQTFLSRIPASFIFSNDNSNESKIQILLRQSGKLFDLSERNGDASDRYGYRGRIFDPFTLSLILVGILAIVLTQAGLIILMLTGWFGLALFFFGILTQAPPFWPRLIGVLPVVSIFITFGLRTVEETLGKIRLASRQNSLRLITILSAATIIYLNLKIYFIKYPQESMPDHIGSRIAAVLNTLESDTQVFFLTSPYLDSTHAPIVFLAPNQKTQTIPNPPDFVPEKIENKKTTFIIHPQYYQKGFILRELNPGSILFPVKSIRGEIQFYVFKT